MFPYIIVFSKMITLYAVLAIIGMFAAGIYMCHLTRKRGFDDNDTIILLLFSAIGVLIGGHSLYGITNIKYIPTILESNNLKEFINGFISVFGGSVFYGGLIGGLIAGFIVLKCKKMNIDVFSDMAAVVIPLFHGFARIGCFLSGCCYGIESKFGFTVYNNDLVADINGVNRFPVQLLEALLNFILFYIIRLTYKKSLSEEKLQGKLIFIYLSLYSVIRFFDEFLRGDEIRGFVFGMSTSQFISIVMFFVSSIFLLLDFQRRKSNHTN